MLSTSHIEGVEQKEKAPALESSNPASPHPCVLLGQAREWLLTHPVEVTCTLGLVTVVGGAPSLPGLSVCKTVKRQSTLRNGSVGPPSHNVRQTEQGSVLA